MGLVIEKERKIFIASFYKFVNFIEYEKYKTLLENNCDNEGVLGTILLAHEGINGTIAGKEANVCNVINFIKNNKIFFNLNLKISFAEKNPFVRMKVRLKKEIVTMGIDNIIPSQITGKFVKPNLWNKLISDNSTILIDTRNAYESSIGTFENAITMNTDSFREFPKWVRENLNNKESKIAMFCTGGIRCEKASSYLINEGFTDVYQLDGGVLKYLDEVDIVNSKWRGECFVFDERVSIKHGLIEGRYQMCHACRAPILPKEKNSKFFIEGVSCSNCYNKTSAESKKRFAQRQLQIRLANDRNESHMGPKLKRTI